MKIMVLNDGETFTALDGCKIVDVKDGMDADWIEAALKDEEGTIVQSFTDPPQTFTVIGTYEEPEGQRWAESFEAESVQGAEQLARDAAPGLIIAGVVAGGITLLDVHTDGTDELEAFDKGVQESQRTIERGELG